MIKFFKENHGMFACIIVVLLFLVISLIMSCPSKVVDNSEIESITGTYSGNVDYNQDVYYKWSPQEDITAYELALMVPVILASGSSLYGDMNKLIDKLPPEAKRHLRKIKQ